MKNNSGFSNFWRSRVKCLRNGGNYEEDDFYNDANFIVWD